MIRADIISTIGREYLDRNIENDEFSYQKALKEIGKDITDYRIPDSTRLYKNLDLRFSNDKLSVLIETKNSLTKSNTTTGIKQLQQYLVYEKELTNNNIVAILAGTQTDDICVWIDDSGLIDNNHVDSSERIIRSFDEYMDIFYGTKNDKLAVIQSTYNLNETLHSYGINEKIRSQFVGTCLLALKNGLVYEKLSSAQISAYSDDIRTLIPVTSGQHSDFIRTRFR